MAKGVHARGGPPPDPQALRRDRDDGDWVTLPSEGREGAAPAWPLADPSERELELWRGEWIRPQAVMWERNGQELEVAMYVRSLVIAESRQAPTNTRTLVRQQQEALGLSIPGLMRNRWRIGQVESATAGSRRTGRSVRERFQVVNGGAA